MPPRKISRPGFFALLLGVTFLAYSPCLHGTFLWDDDAYISHNNALTTVQGLHDIWLKPGTVDQYYPVTFTLFWAQYHLWGLNTLGYHIVNVLLHGLNTILLWIILESLGIPGAWIAAWLFALHPVMVESVAWMTELKNVLSTFFYLLTVLMLTKAHGKKKLWSRFHGWALCFFFIAVLSKSITVTLPVSFFLISTWITGVWDRRKFLQILPLLTISLGAALFTIYYEHHWVGAQGGRWTFTLLERVIIAGHAFWFYVWKLLCPSPLVFIYPCWLIQPQNYFSYLYLAGILVFFALLAYGRRWWGKLPFACFLFYILSLSPTLGLTSFYFMQFSFVADHFQYLASLGLFTLTGYGIVQFLEMLTISSSSVLSVTLVVLLCADLSLLTAKQARTYQDSLQLWGNTLRFNPDSAIAHHNFGIALSEQGQWNLAIAHLRTAEALNPAFPQTHLALAYFAVHAERWEDARHQYEEAIRLGVHDPQVLKDFAALPPAPIKIK